MRQITSFAAAAFIVAAIAGWVAASNTSAGTVKAGEDFPGRYSIGAPALPIIF